MARLPQRNWVLIALGVSGVLPIMITVYHQNVMNASGSMGNIPPRMNRFDDVDSGTSTSRALASALERATQLVVVQNQTLHRLEAELVEYERVLGDQNILAQRINSRIDKARASSEIDGIIDYWQQEARRAENRDGGNQITSGIVAFIQQRFNIGRAIARSSEPKSQRDLIVPQTRGAAQQSKSFRIAHIVNLLPRGMGHSDQDVIVQSMINAKAFTEKQAAAGEKVPVVELFSVEYADDTETRVRRDTSLIKEAPNLIRHVYDLYNLRRFDQIKFQKLPLISDILQSVIDATDAPYITYSNADIGLQPEFYVEAAKYLADGHNALAINRVEIPTNTLHNAKLGAKDMDEIYALGRKHEQSHQGYDCFIFHRNIVPFLQLYLRSAFIGYPPIGGKMNEALQCMADYRVVRGKHLTFHLGIKNGGWGEDSEFEFYNRKAVKKSLADFQNTINSLAGVSNSYGACNQVKRATRSPDSKIAHAVRREYQQRSFVFPKYPKLPKWEVEYNQQTKDGTRVPVDSSFAPAIKTVIERKTSEIAGPNCLNPEEARPENTVKKLIMASSGRVGSTVLAQVLSEHGIRVDHTHFSVDRIIKDQRRAGTSHPVLYIFADPIDVILSLRQRDIDTGDSFFGKNISWVRKHFENMRQDHLFEAWARGEYFTTDVLQLEQQFDSWHRSMPFPFMSLRYETERNYLDKLAAFLGTKRPIKLPILKKKGKPIAGSKGKVPREERFRRLDSRQQNDMSLTYGNLRNKVKAAPDFCIWKEKK